MNKFSFYMLFVLFSVIEVRAEEAAVIEIKKNIPMTKMDKVYKNYIINGGTQLGLNKGTIVDVLRRVPIHDPLRNAAIGDLKVKVAEVEIIHSDSKISVARLSSLETPEDRPVLDYEAVMVGDRLDLGSIRVAAKPEPKVESKPEPQPAAQAVDPQMGQQVALLEKKQSKTKVLIHEGDRSLASMAAKKKKTMQRKPAAASGGGKKMKKKKTKKLLAKSE